MNWSEDQFWHCSWGGFLDAWNGHSRFVLGLDPEAQSMSRPEAEDLEAQLRAWQNREAHRRP